MIIAYIFDDCSTNFVDLLLLFSLMPVSVRCAAVLQCSITLKRPGCNCIIDNDG